MRNYILILLLVLAAASAPAQEADSALDNNTAFFEGGSLSYIVPPPSGFVMIMEDAIADGYSFAFIPEGEQYDSATIRIGVNIFRIKDEMQSKISLADIIAEDTTAIRQHFGETLTISEVDSVMTKSGFTIRNIYLNDSSRFIPNVMMSYLDGGSEILIFDLSIVLDQPRFTAEQLYMECLEKLKILVKGKIEVG